MKTSSTKTIKELRAFLGIPNFIRESVKGYTTLMETLFKLLRGEKIKSNKSLRLTGEELEIFKKIKNNLCEKYGKVPTRS